MCLILLWPDNTTSPSKPTSCSSLHLIDCRWFVRSRTILFAARRVLRGIHVYRKRPGILSVVLQARSLNPGPAPAGNGCTLPPASTRPVGSPKKHSRRCHRSVAISCWFLIIFVNASSCTFGSAQELGVEAMRPFTHYVVKAHGNSRDVIVHLIVLVRSQLASEKVSPKRRCDHRSCDVTGISLTFCSAKLSAGKQSVS